jgi:hypothetical protein
MELNAANGCCNAAPEGRGGREKRAAAQFADIGRPDLFALQDNHLRKALFEIIQLLEFALQVSPWASD